jgi:hypothetical protein
MAKKMNIDIPMAPKGAKIATKRPLGPKAKTGKAKAKGIY